MQIDSLKHPYICHGRSDSGFLFSQGSVTVTVKADDDDAETQPLGLFGMSNDCVQRHTNITSMQKPKEAELDDKLAKRLRKIRDTWQKPAKRPPPHMVDLVARCLFPFTYGLFNFVYWWTQLN